MAFALCAESADLAVVMAVPVDGEEKAVAEEAPVLGLVDSEIKSSETKSTKPLPANPTREQCEKETVATLKSWCRQLGTSVTGKKDWLVHRILNPSTNQKGFPDSYILEQQGQQEQQKKKQKVSEVQVQGCHVPSNGWEWHSSRYNFAPSHGTNDENHQHQQLAWQQPQQQPSLYVEAYQYVNCVELTNVISQSVEQTSDTQPEPTPSRFLSLGSLEQPTAEVVTFDPVGCTTTG